MKRAPSTARLEQTDNVDRFVGVAYDNVKIVADHMDRIIELTDNLQAILDVNANLGSPGMAASFETISKNLSASDAVIVMEGDEIDTITYANGVVKTFGYGPDGLSTITLSGNVPSGIALTKTLTYLAGNVVEASYS